MPKITIRVANAEKLETQFLPELASGGLFIRSDKFLPLGSEVDIDLYLPSATEPLPLRGRVTRVVDDDDARARKATGMTLAVDTNSEPTRSRLDALYAAYRIPVRKSSHDADVTPGHPVKSSHASHGSNGSNGAMGMVVPLPGPSSRPAPADDDLPSPKGAAAPDLPAPPSIAPAVPPIPVMKFQKRTSSNDAIPLPGGPGPSPDLSADSTASKGGDRPLPFPFSRSSSDASVPPKIPGFGDLSAPELHSAPPPPPIEAVTPPPPPRAAVEERMADSRAKQTEEPRRAAADRDAAEARHGDALRGAESKHSESLKAAENRYAESLKALEAKHAETVKRLNDELTKLQKQKSGEPQKRSPLPAALLGLVVGAAAAAAYFMVVAPPAVTTTTGTNTVATTKTPVQTQTGTVVAVANTGNDANKTGTGTGSGSDGTTKTNDTGTGSNPAVLTGLPAKEDAGTTLAVAKPEVHDAGTAQVAAVVPEKVQDAGTGIGMVAMTDKPKDAGTTLLASAEVHNDAAVTNKVEEKKPPVVEEKKPNPEQDSGDELADLGGPKKPTEKKGPVPLQANAGTLTLSADLPATVYVNGKKVGNAPISGVKVNPGKISVRFDCVVEDVRVKGKTKTVNVAPNGTAKVEYSCVE
ncbi:MAG: PilZ domain-containing protein [Myxococcaceae bacterium]